MKIPIQGFFFLLALSTSVGSGSRRNRPLDSAEEDKIKGVVSVDGAVPGQPHSRKKREAIKDTTKNSLTQADREAFINAHNAARTEVEPAAANMAFMVSTIVKESCMRHVSRK